MKAESLQPGDLVVVLWEDAAHAPDEVPGTYLTATAGFLVEMSEKTITVCKDWFSDGQARNFDSMPAGMVKKVVAARALERIGRRLAKTMEFKPINSGD